MYHVLLNIMLYRCNIKPSKIIKSTSVDELVFDFVLDRIYEFALTNIGQISSIKNISMVG